MDGKPDFVLGPGYEFPGLDFSHLVRTLELLIGYATTATSDTAREEIGAHILKLAATINMHYTVVAWKELHTE